MKAIHTLLFICLGFFYVESQTWTWLDNGLLSYPRSGLSAAVLDDSIFYSGGAIEYASTFVNTVDIFDLGEGTWSIAELPNPQRWFTTSIAAGGKVFIAGGSNFSGYENFKEINMYDRATDQWFVEYLSEGRSWIGVVACENKVYFAGGNINVFGSVEYSNAIDIWDLETNTWLDKEELSVHRGFVGAAAADGKVFFAGGRTGEEAATDVIDVYDTSTGEWTVEYLSEPRGNIAVIAYDNRVYFAGGNNPDVGTVNVIDVYNVADEGWEDPIYLATTRIVHAVKVMDALIFSGMTDAVGYSGAGGLDPPNGVIEIYYPATGTWDYSVPPLDPERYFYAYASYGDKAYFAGGESQGAVDVINILQYNPVGTNEKNLQERPIQVFPNPFESSIAIKYHVQENTYTTIAIHSNTGALVKVLTREFQQKGDHEVCFDSAGLSPGIYYFVISDKSSNAEQIKKIIKL